MAATDRSFAHRRTRLVAALSFCALSALQTAARADAPAAEPESTRPPEPDLPVAPPAHHSDLTVHAASEVSGYGDTNHVFVVTPTIAATVANPLEGYSFGARYLVDVVSAASVDIVSTASRRWEEVRHVGSLDGGYRLGGFDLSANANVSDEPDYLSLGASGAISRDFLQKNLTVLLGYNHRHDTIGRSGTPFSVFSRKLDINGLKAGVSIVLGKATILSIVGDVIFEDGDPSKPYRYVPLFAPGTVVPKGASIDFVNANRTSARTLEQLPLERTRYAASARIAHRFSSTTLRFDERLYKDNWGLASSTTDARFLFDLGSRIETGPHLRFHGQAPVDFWQRAYVLQGGFDFPAIRTGDRELGPLVTLTGGGELRFFLGPENEPRRWMLGFDFGVSRTQYLDDLYITNRVSGIGAVSLEADF